MIQNQVTMSDLQLFLAQSLLTALVTHNPTFSTITGITYLTLNPLSTDMVLNHDSFWTK